MEGLVGRKGSVFLGGPQAGESIKSEDRKKFFPGREERAVTEGYYERKNLGISSCPN